MSTLLTWLDADQVQKALPRYCLAMRQWLGGRRETRGENKRLISDVMRLVATETAIAGWDIKTLDQFVLLGFSMVTDEIQHAPASGSDTGSFFEELRERAQLLCNIAATHPDVPATTKGRLCGLWVHTQLEPKVEVTDLERFASAASTALEPIGIPEQARIDHVKAQLILRFSRPLARDQAASGPRLQQITEWCEDLVHKPELHQLVKGAARTLGVDLPEAVSPPRTSSPHRVDVPPTIMVIPTGFSDTELATARDTILIQLLAHASLADSHLSDETKNQVDVLMPDTPSARLQSTFYFAAGDLWKGYWTTGSLKLLQTVRDIARFLYSLASLQSVQDHRQSNNLHLRVASQLPDLLLTCEIPDLIIDASRLFPKENCRLTELALNESIVEAFAGICRRLETDGDTAEREDLLREYRTSLQTVHNEYEKNARAMPASAWIEKARSDEQNAWESLFPHGVEPLPLAGTILVDRDFKTVINRGDHEETYEFARMNHDRIETLLRNRLKIHLGTEDVMMPVGTITVSRARARRQDNPQYIQGKKALKENDYGRAAQFFGQLSEWLDGKAREIASDYCAYSLAKAEQQVNARVYLNRLCDSGYSYASAYWNLACCLASNQMDQQLEALARGLDIAPHTRLLQGAVYLLSSA